jgi:hypothetical protein
MALIQRILAQNNIRRGYAFTIAISLYILHAKKDSIPVKKYHSYIFKMFRKIYYSTGIGKCQDLSNGLFVYKLFVRFCLPIRLAAFDVFIDNLCRGDL